MKKAYEDYMRPQIIQESENWLVINKPSGLDCQSSREGRPSVANWLLKHYRFSGLVHRLDYGTSGLMVCAKNSVGARQLSALMKTGKMKRTYRCICLGVINANEGVINNPIEGKECITHFHILERFKNATYVECNLSSGRKHQIRIHLHSMGYPVIGDHRYKSKGSHLLLKRPALHAWSLQWEEHFFQCPLPTDMDALLARLRSNHKERIN